MNNVCESFSDLGENNVVLIVNNRHFRCNKNCLQNASPYFQAMFNSSMKESTADEISIRDVEPIVFKVLLDYAHSNHMPIFSSNENDLTTVFEILQASCIFQFDEVSKQCCKHLSNVMDSSNCLKIWDLADVLALPKLRLKAKTYSLWNGDEMLGNDDILEASFETLHEIISNDGLNVKSEMNVLRSVLNWIKENNTNDKKKLKLLDEIRVDDLEDDEMRTLEESVRKELSFRNKECSAKKPSPFVMMSKHKLKTRNIPAKALLYGYSFRGRKNKLSIHLYVQNERWFKEITSICVHLKTLSGLGVCVVGKDIYMFGGREKAHYGKWNQQMWKYDSLKEKWLVMPPVSFCRRAFVCLALGNCIYVLGGYGEQRVIDKSMMCFDTDTGVWSTKATPPGLNAFSVVAGIYRGSSVLYYFSTGLYIYMPKDDEWFQIKDTAVANRMIHAVDYEGHLYLMTQDAEGNGVIVYLYDPEEDLLTPIASSLSEDCVNFCVINGNIFIYTDIAVELISAPSSEGSGLQLMFKQRNEQGMALTSPLKFVGLLPFYGC